MKRLDSLPGNKSKYWEHAEVNEHELKIKPKCQHHFVQKTGVEVSCDKGCGAVYFLLQGRIKLKDGHLYAGKKLVI